MVDGGYPARRVFGYYSKEELHSLIVKRKLDKIKDNRVDTNISDRPFIQMACTAVCDAYSAKRRSALNVMATGTGKTRFAISLVDILMRNDWIEHILFLADRKELVSQAFKAFKKHLPDSTCCAVYSGSPMELDPNARIVVSTYQSVSGAGLAAINELRADTEANLKGEKFENKAFKHNIGFNVIPQIDVFTDNGYTKEEMKVTNETRKILHLSDDVKISCTAVRVPVYIGHSEAVSAEFYEEVNAKEATFCSRLLSSRLILRLISFNSGVALSDIVKEGVITL